MTNLAEYMNQAISEIVSSALRTSLKNPKESRFLLHAGSAQKKAAELRGTYEKNGTHVPPFLIASITQKCNLHCAGCYARANHSCMDHPTANEMDADRWDEIFREAEELGVSFLLLAGGEPLTRADILTAAASHQNLIFPVFTNGTLVRGELLDRFDSSRNLIPVLSIEGDREHTDIRRGKGIYDMLAETMEQLKKRGIFYGVSITVTKDNLCQVTDREYLRLLKHAGCGLVFYVEYVPVESGSEQLAPGERERVLLEQRLDRLREEFHSIIFLSFPGDEKALGGCLAAGRGFFHISAAGAAEPCPFSPFSDTSVLSGGLKHALDSGLFRKIRESGIETEEHTGGCTLFAKEKEVRALLGE
ncbi:radical SAM/SPASM domain-containing protein [Caproicibacter sp.]|uniref:radical SAM/SPASM domain-containing protein n=1 Tax=Caproicibacter sp. TaxID=2814884 RepID=UPI003989618F